MLLFRWPFYSNVKGENIIEYILTKLSRNTFYSWSVFTIKSIHSRHVVTYGSTLTEPPFLKSIMFNKNVDVYFIVYYAFLE